MGRGADPMGVTLLSHKPPDEDGVFLAVLTPPRPSEDAPLVPRDLVFVLDVSGSMGAQGKLEQARACTARRKSSCRRWSGSPPGTGSSPRTPRRSRWSARAPSSIKLLTGTVSPVIGTGGHARFRSFSGEARASGDGAGRARVMTALRP